MPAVSKPPGCGAHLDSYIEGFGASLGLELCGPVEPVSRLAISGAYENDAELAAPGAQRGSKPTCSSTECARRPEGQRFPPDGRTRVEDDAHAATAGVH